MMSDFQYRKVISGGTTYNEGSVITCQDCYIKAEGTWPSAPTFTGAGFVCDTTAELTATGSATIVVDKLVAKKVSLTAHASSTIVVRDLQCDDLVVDIVDSSTVRIEKGSTIARASGAVRNASTGVCRAPIQKDEVQVSGASTWDTNR